MDVTAKLVSMEGYAQGFETNGVLGSFELDNGSLCWRLGCCELFEGLFLCIASGTAFRRGGAVRLRHGARYFFFFKMGSVMEYLSSDVSRPFAACESYFVQVNL